MTEYRCPRFSSCVCVEQVGNAWTDAGIDNYGALFYDWTHAIISDAAYYGVANTVGCVLATFAWSIVVKPEPL